eukprot:CAMPEP_0119014252 /NCGR_PEP_ID=MMETSP1176-20130426/9438_1 /TAXON_ID=265551 /ORGANISM="Synedropsis recta cf, Strain CCMP1620" /LENGTH=168 /DNA_ID=CAMNT_0006967407 /DNA_START=393 /DNA_END=899 /DNA_ORIENTATION=+
MASAIRDRISDSSVLVLALQSQLVLKRVPLSQRSEKIGEAYKKQVQPDRILARVQGIADATSNKEEISRLPAVKNSDKRSLPAVKNNAKRAIYSISDQRPSCTSLEREKLPMKKRKFFDASAPLAPSCSSTPSSTSPSYVPLQLPVQRDQDRPVASFLFLSKNIVARE